MNTIPKRDITGKCEGECRDRVKEGEQERQAQMKNSSVHAPADYPKAPGAGSRNEAPGAYGGHV